MDERLIAGREELTCPVYEKAKYDSVTEVCLLMLKSICDGDNPIRTSTNDFARLPPSRACFREHPTNYQTRIWKTGKVTISELPKP